MTLLICRSRHLCHPRRAIGAFTSAALVLVVLAGFGCGDSGQPGDLTTPRPDSTPPAKPDERSTVRVELTTIAEGLEVPWGFVFLPNGDALYTERDSGRLLRLDPDSGESTEIQTLPTRGFGEGGALGLALSPDFERDNTGYAYITTDEDNRVVRFELGEEPEPVLTGIPRNSFHDGGRLDFGPDGLLYIATGDAGDPAAAQDRESLSGKILRLEPDGSIPDDNPFPDSPVFSLGHRNVEGLAWNANGDLYAPELGENSFDEVNRIEAGNNYGWPEYEGDGGDDADDDGFVNPITTWLPEEASPSAAAFLVDGAIPQWEGNLFVAALRGERLWRLELDGNGEVSEREALYEGEHGRIRNVLQAPDGSLWITTSNRDGRGDPAAEDDRVIRLGRAESSARP